MSVLSDHGPFQSVSRFRLVSVFPGAVRHFMRALRLPSKMGQRLTRTLGEGTFGHPFDLSKITIGFHPIQPTTNRSNLPEPSLRGIPNPGIPEKIYPPKTLQNMGFPDGRPKNLPHIPIGFPGAPDTLTKAKICAGTVCSLPIFVHYRSTTSPLAVLWGERQTYLQRR